MRPGLKAAWRDRRAVIAGGLSMLILAAPSYAAHWQLVGLPSSNSTGLAYIDLDSVHEEEGYRVAIFLTIYSVPVPNAHEVKMDRLTQDTAFDCGKREFALRSTVGYLQGKESGRSSNTSDWKERFRVLPQDVFSQRVLDTTCNAPLASQPEAMAAADAPGIVRLQGPNGSVVGGSPPALSAPGGQSPAQPAFTFKGQNRVPASQSSTPAMPSSSEVTGKPTDPK